MSLSIPDNQDRKNENYSNIESFIENGTGVEDASVTMDRVRAQVSALLSDDEELEMDKTLLQVDRSSCTTSQLEMIRRERNRMHAKKTRLRKKRMLAEMETVISSISLFFNAKNSILSTNLLIGRLYLVWNKKIGI